MLSLYRSNFTVTAFCLVLLVWGLSSATAGQQNKPDLPFSQHAFLVKKVTLRQKRISLADSLGTVSRLAQISIVTDGAPDKLEADIDCDGTVRDVLNQLGVVFDLSWTVSKSGIVLMARRFTDPHERPQMHVSEMRGVVRDLARAFADVPAGKSQADANAWINQLAHSLSPEQDAGLQTHRLTGNDLRPDQADLLGNIILEMTFGRCAREVNEYLPLVDGLAESHLQLKPAQDPRAAGSLTSPSSNNALSPTYDYFYVIRDRNNKLINYMLPKWNVD